MTIGWFASAIFGLKYCASAAADNEFESAAENVHLKSLSNSRVFTFSLFELPSKVEFVHNRW
jgi:hypothetical protein